MNTFLKLFSDLTTRLTTTMDGSLVLVGFVCLLLKENYMGYISIGDLVIGLCILCTIRQILLLSKNVVFSTCTQLEARYALAKDAITADIQVASQQAIAELRHEADIFASHQFNRLNSLMVPMVDTANTINNNIDRLRNLGDNISRLLPVENQKLQETLDTVAQGQEKLGFRIGMPLGAFTMLKLIDMAALFGHWAVASTYTACSYLATQWAVSKNPEKYESLNPKTLFTLFKAGAKVSALAVGLLDVGAGLTMRDLGMTSLVIDVIGVVVQVFTEQPFEMPGKNKRFDQGYLPDLDSNSKKDLDQVARCVTWSVEQVGSEFVHIAHFKSGFGFFVGDHSYPVMHFIYSSTPGVVVYTGAHGSDDATDITEYLSGDKKLLLLHLYWHMPEKLLERDEDEEVDDLAFIDRLHLLKDRLIKIYKANKLQVAITTTSLLVGPILYYYFNRRDALKAYKTDVPLIEPKKRLESEKESTPELEAKGKTKGRHQRDDMRGRVQAKNSNKPVKAVTKRDYIVYDDSNIIDLFVNDEPVSKTNYLKRCNGDLPDGHYRIIRDYGNGRTREEEFTIDKRYNGPHTNRYTTDRTGRKHVVRESYTDGVWSLSCPGCSKVFNHFIERTEDEETVLADFEKHVGSCGKILAPESLTCVHCAKVFEFNGDNMATVAKNFNIHMSQCCPVCTKQITSDMTAHLDKCYKKRVAPKMADKGVKLEAVIASSASFKTDTVKQFTGSVLSADKSYLQGCVNTTLGLIMNRHSYLTARWVKFDKEYEIPLEDGKPILIETSFQHEDFVLIKGVAGPPMARWSNKKQNFAVPKEGQDVCLVTIRGSMNPGKVKKIADGDLETTCTSLPGDCGCPYVDSNGRVVGFHYGAGKAGQTNLAIAVDNRLHEDLSSSKN